MKLVRHLIIFVVLAFVLLLFFREAVLKTAVRVTAGRLTGLTVDISRLRIGIFKPVIDIGSLKIYNPPDFPEKLMLEMPQLFIRYEPMEMLKGKLSFKEMRIDLKEFNVIKDKDGATNIAKLTALAGSQEAGKEKSAAAKKEAAMPPMHIGTLRLDIGRIVYKDFSAHLPSVKTFDVNIHKEYRDINDPAHLVRIIVMESLLKTNIKGLSDVDIASLKDSVKGVMASGKEVMRGAVGVATGTLGSTQKAVGGVLKGLFSSQKSQQ